MGEKLPDEIEGATEVDAEDDINRLYWQRAIFAVKDLENLTSVFYDRAVYLALMYWSFWADEAT